MPKRQSNTVTSTVVTGEKGKIAAVAEKGSDAQPSRPVDGHKMDVDGDEEMGEFEDPFEDEVDEDEELVEHDEDSDGVDMMEDNQDDDSEEESEEAAEKKRQVYLPGDPLNEGETLQADNSAYHMLHNMSVQWPCLSFDFVPDILGNNRTGFPHTMYAVAGTQADRSYRNQVLLLKWSQLHRTIHDDLDDEDKDDDIEDLDEDPILETKTLRHQGGVNRIRALQSRESPLTATWADTGKVHIWDIKKLMDAFETPGAVVPTSAQQPLFTIASHGSIEGYAMDWNPDGRLLTGDCNSKIYLTTRRSDTGANFVADRNEFRGHTASVEDIQWSPEEASVFASCSVDQSIKIWDVRAKNHGYALDVPNAHDADVNVISWNRKARYLLASGGDNGDFKVWDMRKWTDPNGRSTPAAEFHWHKKAVTSIEWCPTDESVLAVSGADNQLSLWDLAVELDAEEEARHKEAMVGSDGALRQVPAQLLFIHQGQTDIKELHWHPQVPGALASTAATGFNVFKTISV
ncbi:WD40 repeat-like protein [Coemansia reversa NRRL 1564]|uniref:WD40 repeat-like protein n=1 Tax=Coemansia reversa (strain ATCC 12441 / NRRL 1564) TaxID=763665 RepID=A0A2G5BBT6_COERN|nr:WD40 repeat-like protein [Coemansia reversa NRRL 1564]|eukprot:PIA16478.1 WD40 repeat-like protein [Coemansia reversa NRRL 1564]